MWVAFPATMWSSTKWNEGEEMPSVIGVDSSTQNCKVLVVDVESGQILAEATAPHPEGTEVDPSAWWTALQSSLGQVDGSEVEAISIGAQQHGLVALDASGEIVRPALLWNDTRSAPQAEQIIAKFGAANIAQRTGSVPVASFTSTKLAWVKQHEPEIAARIAAVALPHDWLTWRLRGYGPAKGSRLGPDLERLVTDRSDASGTGYFCPTTNSYDDDIVDFRTADRVQEAIREKAGLPRYLAERLKYRVPGPLWPFVDTDGTVILETSNLHPFGPKRRKYLLDAAEDGESEAVFDAQAACPASFYRPCTHRCALSCGGAA